MDSLFGDDGVDDLFNDNIQEDHELPSGDEGQPHDGQEKEGNEAAEDPAIKVEPKKRTVRTRVKLSVDTLSGPRGIHTIENYFKDIKFKGKGHEKEDLDEVLKRLQHWGHRMYPNYKFVDVLNNIESLGKKKPLQVHMSRYRLGMLENLTTAVGEIIEEESGGLSTQEEPFDEFDALLDEQIAISRLAPRTPASTTNTLATPSSSLTTPSFRRDNALMSTPYSGVGGQLDTSELAVALPNSQPSTPQPATKHLSNEQLARIAENRRLAQERLRAKKLEQEKHLSRINETTDEVR